MFNASYSEEFYFEKNLQLCKLEFKNCNDRETYFANGENLGLFFLDFKCHDKIPAFINYSSLSYSHDSSIPKYGCVSQLFNFWINIPVNLALIESSEFSFPCEKRAADLDSSKMIDLYLWIASFKIGQSVSIVCKIV